jgi:hypothetical protein
MPIIAPMRNRSLRNAASWNASGWIAGFIGIRGVGYRDGAGAGAGLTAPAFGSVVSVAVGAVVVGVVNGRTIA